MSDAAPNPGKPAAPDLERLRIARDSEALEPRGRGLRWFLIALLLAGAGAAWKLVPRATPVRVGAVLVEGGPPPAPAGSLSANGYVVARRNALLAPSVGGRIAAILVEEGSRVKQGEIIARLQDSAQEAQLASAQAALAQVTAQIPPAERAAARAKLLLEGQAGTGVDLERANDALTLLLAQEAAARAQLRVAEVALEETRVRAPFDGTVLEKQGELGEFVAPGGAGLGGAAGRGGIVTLADLDTLEVEVDVNEAYIGRVSEQQPARVTLDSLPDVQFAGAVARILPTADRQKATVQVRVSITEKDPRILPEMGAKVSFVSAEEAAAAAAAQEAAAQSPRKVVVPAGAVSRGADGAQRVFVVDQGTARVRIVTLGALQDKGWEVTDGLLGGESVVLDPPADLADASKVRPSP
jgi:RND family efflux transporter MFP subunit